MWRCRTARWALACVVVALVALLAGCARAPAVGGARALPAGSSQQVVRVGGADRTFEVYRPASLPPGPAPLVVMLHGGFGSGSQAESSYGWDAEADSQHFLVVYPDGEQRAWNVGGGCCGTPGRTGVDDVAFITAVVARVGAATAIDPDRVYATGISNGGMLAYRLACDTTLFAAIAPDSATQLGPCPRPSPVSVIHLHGTADRNIPYAGGTGDGVAQIDGPAVPALNATWRAVDGCGSPVVVRKGVVTTSTAPCAHGRAVVLVTIDGAGHQWPGATARPVLEKVLGLDPPSTAMDATGTIWEFFATHPRTAA